MKEILILTIGYTVAILSAVTMLPQIIKTIRTKNVQDISMIMLTLYITNTGLWVAYGILIGALPVVIADGLACFAGTTQLVLKLKYQNI
jgi:MtN3 and saliva related transmembrane protein